MICGIKKSVILTHILAIATNILVLLMTGFVVQGHIRFFCCCCYFNAFYFSYISYFDDEI